MLREPKVGEQRARSRSRRIAFVDLHQHVRRFQITMQNGALVSVVNRVGQVCDDVGRRARVAAASLLGAPFVERRPWTIGAGDETDGADFARLENGDMFG